VNSLVVLYFMWITHKKKPLRSKFTVNTNWKCAVVCALAAYFGQCRY
jgi:hypothetical protein